MRLYGVRIWVRDCAAAKAFYCGTLGLPLSWDMAEIGAFGADAGAMLIVEQADPADPESSALVDRIVGVSLQVDDIEAAPGGSSRPTA